MRSVINKNSKIYYQGKYWNDIFIVQKHISKIITGNENLGWIDWFKEKYSQTPFNHALFLNCGDGRWEREFIDKNIIRKATAFDISKEFIQKAKSLKGKRNIKYFVADANKIKLQKNSYDLVVNMAALHHVQYINRLCYQILKSLKKEGLLLNHDYIGPHRNQYSLPNWFLIKLINHTLPKEIRKSNLGYPHLPTMLLNDPTEAIHSDLILPSINRYFKILEKHDYGGGIAYELLTHNDKLFQKISSKRDIDKHIKNILGYDVIFTKLKIIPVFFSLITAKPKSCLNKVEIIKQQRVENLREKNSAKLYCIYTLFDLIKLIIWNNSWKTRLKMITKYFKILFKR